MRLLVWGPSERRPEPAGASFGPVGTKFPRPLLPGKGLLPNRTCNGLRQSPPTLRGTWSVTRIQTVCLEVTGTENQRMRVGVAKVAYWA